MQSPSKQIEEYSPTKFKTPPKSIISIIKIKYDHPTETNNKIIKTVNNCIGCHYSQSYYILNGCNHIVFCEDCLNEAIKNGISRCPLCRECFTSVKNAYNSPKTPDISITARNMKFKTRNFKYSKNCNNVRKVLFT